MNTTSDMNGGFIPIPVGPVADVFEGEVQIQKGLIEVAKKAGVGSTWNKTRGLVGGLFGSNSSCDDLVEEVKDLLEQARSTEDQLNDLLVPLDDEEEDFQYPPGMGKSDAERIRFQLLQMNEDTLELAEACRDLLYHKCGVSRMGELERKKAEETFKHYRDHIQSEHNRLSS